MRSFITLFALVAAANAATSPLVAREDVQTCAMKTLLSSSACNTGDAACLCSDAARKSVMEEIKAACGVEQSESTNNLATEACRMQKVRRATMPSATASQALPSSSSSSSSSPSASDRVNGADNSSDGGACTCANTGASRTTSNSPAAVPVEDGLDTSPSSHRANAPSGTSTENEAKAQSPAQSSRVHAASVMATPATAAAAASSSVARHGAMVTPASSSIAIPTPSGADPFAQFRGAGAQVVPSMTVLGGVLAGIVGAFVAL